MPEAVFRLYAELNDLLPVAWRQRDLPRRVGEGTTVKDAVEALGVPHTEVEVILANGVSVDFAYRVREGDRIAVYPVFEGIDVTPLLRLRARPLRDPRFVLDGHLGKLARYLRLLGFDALYETDPGDAELARVSVAERRILLTRDRGLLKRREITHGYAVRGDDPRRQLAEVVARFDLVGLFAPFSRCTACNGLAEPIERDQVADRLPPAVREAGLAIWSCGSCRKLYWRGPHARRLEQLVASLAGEGREGAPREARESPEGARKVARPLD
jgi:uncharacterized protein with PIN domain/sulfur carrier protein ThiS